MPKQYGTPGPRSLWPTITRSVPLARCSIEAQLLFERLISQADDQGRLQGEPVLVAAVCLPLVKKATPKAVEKWIEELVEAELIVWYQAKGQWLIQLRNWWDHQSGQRWVYPSRWPAPRGWDDRAPKVPNLPESFRQTAGNLPESRRNPAGVTPASASASASAVANNGAGRTPAHEPVILTDDQRAESIRVNQELVDNPETADVVRKAAQRTLDRLEAASHGG